MLLGHLRTQSKTLIKLWGIILCVQLLCFMVTSIIASASSPHSSAWFFEFLTITKGLPNGKGVQVMGCATAFLIINAVLTFADFVSGYGVHKEIRSSFSKTYSNQELIVLNEMKKKLKWVLIFILVALFMQALHGFLWWVVGGCSLLFKYFYFKELSYLEPKQIVTPSGTEIWVH